jgi:hypothetical protein
MVASMVLFNAQQGYALLDLRATHSFMSYKLLTNWMWMCKLDRWLAIGTLLGEIMNVDKVYEGCNV